MKDWLVSLLAAASLMLLVLWCVYVFFWWKYSI